MKISEKKLFSSLRENTISAVHFYSRNIGNSYFMPKLSRFINKYLYYIGLASSLNRYDNSFTIYSSFADKKLYSNYKKNDKFINFGSGAFFHKRWKNYDYPGQSKYYQNLQGIEGKDFYSIDLNDINLKISEIDESVELIYCSHTLEHLDNKSSLRFLSECFRILKKGGVLRVALPNTKNDFYLCWCLISQDGIDENLKKNYIRDATNHILTDCKDMSFEKITELIKESEYDSRLFYEKVIENYPDNVNFKKQNPERHVNYVDFRSLIKTVNEIGFKSTIPTYQGSSVVSPFTNLHVFDSTEPHISFYADIVK